MKSSVRVAVGLLASHRSTPHHTGRKRFIKATGCPNTALRTAPNAMNLFPLYSNISQMRPPTMCSVTNDFIGSPGTGLSQSEGSITFDKKQHHSNGLSSVPLTPLPCFMNVGARAGFNVCGFLWEMSHESIQHATYTGQRDTVPVHTQDIQMIYNGLSLTLSLFHFSNWETNEREIMKMLDHANWKCLCYSKI